jgi:hypothetical protein
MYPKKLISKNLKRKKLFFVGIRKELDPYPNLNVTDPEQWR